MVTADGVMTGYKRGHPGKAHKHRWSDAHHFVKDVFV